MQPRGLALAGAVAAATSGAMAFATRKIVSGYFPLADEWAIQAHSHPRVADVRSWFTEGFRNYFTAPDGIPPVPGGSFSRPLFNATYWAIGHWAGPESGRFLRLNQAAVGACAGLTSLSVARSGGSSRVAAGTGALVPLMPALVPSLQLLIYPCMAFDPVTACLSQSAVLAYDRGHARTATGLLAAGVLTKETALPTATVLPALYAVEHRREFLHSAKARRTLATLAMPVALWYGANRAAFGDTKMKEGAYVLRDDPRGRLVRQLRIASKFPFWADVRPLKEPGLTPGKLAAGAKLAANALIVGGVFAEIGKAWRTGRPLTTDEGTLLASYAFMNAVGISPRYGVTLDMSLLTSRARWRRATERPSAGVRAVTGGLALGLAADAVQVARDYPETERNFLVYAEVGRKYVAALRKYGADARVLVLNDPVTFWAPVKWLTRALGIRAEVIKLADHPWSARNLEGITTPSTVELQPPAQPGEPWRFVQSQGSDILASHSLLSSAEHTHIEYGDGVAIDLEPADADTPAMDARRRWSAMRITPGNRPAHLLYYDPAASEFRSVAVPPTETERNPL